MFRLAALWAVLVAAALWLILTREERLAARGKVPLGRLRRFWLKSERRRAPRYRVNWPVRYQRVAATAINPAKSRDLSATGVALVVSERLEIGSRIQMELSLPNRSAPLMVTGQVIWRREGPGADQRIFYIGVHFLGLQPETSKALTEALKKSA